ncbi:MAG: mycofactocin system GMC family oxidoreductase MftG [Nakamurella sp.]
MSRFDVVVVGAGAGGSVVAGRLSEDPARSVLLLEAGETPRSTSAFPPALLDGARVPGAQPALGHHWEYPVQLTAERAYSVFRGRVLGGSTTTNGGYFIRARLEDFGSWSQAGNPAWAYDRVLPFMRALERDLDYGSTDIHGDSGPVPVRRPAMTGSAAATFADACVELGHRFEPDMNAQGAAGFGALPLNIADGVRWNTGLAYVLPALHRPNLTVIGGCTVRRIRFRGTRAVGLDVRLDGTDSALEADEIVLCAGAFESPHVLMRSGIGPAGALRDLAVPVVFDLPAVGRRFNDHPQVVVEWMPKAGRGDVSSWISGCVNFASTGGPVSGDLQILQANVSMGVLTGHPPARSAAALPLLVSVNSPMPTGSLRMLSADPDTPLDIRYGYLSTPADSTRLRDAVRGAFDLLCTKAFAAAGNGPVDLDRRVVRDDELLDRWIRERLGTTLHACGTAPMAPAADPDAAVDQFGRVHGLERLRVADTSILPAAPLRGPAATAVLIGEVVADALRHNRT